MSTSYVFKRLIHGWPLFIALLLGVILAATFFAGINMGADTSARQAMTQQLNNVYADVSVVPSYNYMSPQMSQTQLSSQNITSAIDAISKIPGVTAVAVVSSVYVPIEFPANNISLQNCRLVGFFGNSTVADTWLSGIPAIGQNEVYIWSGSADAQLFKVGDVIPLNFTIGQLTGDFPQGSNLYFSANLTVAGHIILTDQALAIANNQYSAGGFPNLDVYSGDNLLIVNWDRTVAGLLDTIYDNSTRFSNVDTRIVVYLDRARLISPWDTSGSVAKIQAVTLQINSAVSEYNLEASNLLENVLNNYQGASMSMRFVFIIAALPVFFVAWYMGSTVSNVSFNLRRREIALLSTKGFSNRQLLSMFLLEAILIGVLGGLFGVILSFTLNPWFVAAAGGQFAGTPVVALDSVVLTIVFAIAIALLSAYRPAKRAANMTTVDALKEYAYAENARQGRHLRAWVALILGSLKMVVFLLGINLITQVSRLGISPGNAIVFLLLSLIGVVDFILIFIGPFLFFWGFTKIFIQGSKKFQQIIERIAKSIGDLGELASKSVQRNPVRIAAVAFLVAFIIGYSFIIVGATASIQDVSTRQSHFTVGSDISVTFNSPTNVSTIMSTISNNVSRIRSMTAEYQIYGSAGLGSNAQSMQLRAVDPSTWLSVAYVENDLFTGNSAQKAFQTMQSNNHTIIMEVNLAQSLNKKIGDTITVTFGATQDEQLTIVGFYGVMASQSPGQNTPGYLSQQFWSYIPQGLYQELGANGTSYTQQTRILIKLENSADSKSIADQVRNLKTNSAIVDSVAEEAQQRQSNATTTGMLNIMQLGVMFFVLAASVGTALVVFVSLRERKREASIMSVRGLSYKQLLVMLLTENLAVITLALVLGTVFGLVAMRGTISALNSFNVFGSPPLNMHIVFPSNSLLIIGVSYVLIYAATILPVIIMTRMYSSRLERTVREN